MSSRFLVGVLVSAGAFVFAACGDDSSEADIATVELRVVAFTPGEDNVPIEGAEVCFVDTDDCQTTEGDGIVMLSMPVDAETAVTIEADGFNPTLSPQVAESSAPAARDVSMLSLGLVELLAMSVDTPYPPENTGFVAVTLLAEPRDVDSAIPGVTVQLAEPDGRRYYLDDDGLPDTSLTATSGLGTAGFIELTPGVHEVELGGTARNCTRLAGWAGQSADRMRFPVRAGFFVNTLLICDPP